MSGSRPASGASHADKGEVVTDTKDAAQAQFEALLPKAPRMKDNGFTVAPYLYPRLLHKVAALIDALNALEDDDPNGKEDSHFANIACIPVYDQAAFDERDECHALVGWVWAVDAGAWTFVPYIPEIEQADR